MEINGSIVRRKRIHGENYVIRRNVVKKQLRTINGLRTRVANFDFSESLKTR